MGAKSTIDITRAEAIDFIITHLINADDDTIAYMVENLNDELWNKHDYDKSLGLHNFHVIGG